MNSYETIIAIVLMIILGYICRRFDFLKSEDTQTLNKIVVYIAIPSLTARQVKNSFISKGVSSATKSTALLIPCSALSEYLFAFSRIVTPSVLADK